MTAQRFITLPTLLVALATMPAASATAVWACQSRSGQPDFVGTEWTATSINVQGTMRAPEPNAPVTAIFDGDFVTGNTGCNEYKFPYEDMGEGNIFVGTLEEVTERACEGIMGQESTFLSKMPTVRSYGFNCDSGSMELYDESGTVQITFQSSDGQLQGIQVEEEPKTLPGTNWSAAMFSLMDGTSLRTVQAGSTITATFTEEGKVEGISGCNSYRGSYQSDSESIRVTEMNKSKKMCQEGGLMDQEAAYLHALTQAYYYKIEDDRLTLLTPERKVLVTYFATEDMPITAQSMCDGQADLIDTKWKGTGMHNGMYLAPASSDKMLAVFEKDGKLTGSTGCNTFEMGYQVSGSVLTMGEFNMVTEMACGSTETALETQFLSSLSSVVSYQIFCDQLELANDLGKVVLSFVAPTQSIDSDPTISTEGMEEEKPVETEIKATSSAAGFGWASGMGGVSVALTVGAMGVQYLL